MYKNGNFTTNEREIKAAAEIERLKSLLEIQQSVRNDDIAFYKQQIQELNKKYLEAQRRITELENQLMQTQTLSSSQYTWKDLYENLIIQHWEDPEKRAFLMAQIQKLEA